MKTLKVILISIISVILLLCIGLFIALKVFVNEDRIKPYVVEYAKNNLDREVSFDGLSFHIFGIDLNNFKMSEKSTFNEGTFIKADKLALDVSLLPLLYKEIKINNIKLKSLDINVIKSKEGLFNFDDIVKHFQSSQEETQTKQSDKDVSENKSNGKKQDSAFNLKIDNLSIENANLNFEDVIANLKVNIEQFNMFIEHFSFEKEFLCTTSFTGKYKQNKLDFECPVKSEIFVNLNNFDMDKIFLNIKNLETSIKDSGLAVNGTLKGFNICDIDCNISLKNINEKLFENFCDLQTKFNIESIDFKTKTTVNVSSGNANIESLSLVLPKSSSNLSGNIDWSKQDLEYDLKLNANISLDGLSSFFPKNNAAGNFNTDISLNQNKLNAVMKLDKIFYNGSFGKIENLNTDVSLEVNSTIPLQKIDFKDFNADELILKIEKLTSKYNNSNVELTTLFVQGPKSKLDFTFKADNISNDTISDFCKVPVNFIVPKADVDLSTDFSLKKKTATINKFNINLSDSLADIKGTLNWNNKKNFVYNLKVNLNLLLDNIAKNFPKYNLAGQIKSNAAVSNTNFSGTLNCKNLAFDYLTLAKVSKLNLDLSAKSKNNITVSKLNGVFNGGKFNADGSYINNNIKVNFIMDKLVINKSTQTVTTKQENKKQDEKNQKEQKQETQKKETTKQTSQKSSPAKIFNIYSDIKISQIDVPYLTSKEATLKSSITNVGKSLAKANGTFDLTISSGTITNTKEFAQDNKYAKTFLSLFNVLNNDKNAKDSNIQKKNKDDIVYKKIKTDVLFTDGLMKTQDVSIDLPATTITAKGTVNFKNEELKLSVNTGAYVTMKVTGTLSDPKTSFDVVGSVADVLSKNVLKGLFGGK